MEQTSNAVPERWLDADGYVVERIAGVWCHPEDGTLSTPVRRQVTAWVDAPDVRAELRAQVSAACRRAGDAEVTE